MYFQKHELSILIQILLIACFFLSAAREACPCLRLMDSRWQVLWFNRFLLRLMCVIPDSGFRAIINPSDKETHTHIVSGICLLFISPWKSNWTTICLQMQIPVPFSQVDHPPTERGTTWRPEKGPPLGEPEQGILDPNPPIPGRKRELD